jgi:hypothetical protein
VADAILFAVVQYRNNFSLYRRHSVLKQNSASSDKHVQPAKEYSYWLHCNKIISVSMFPPDVREELSDITNYADPEHFPDDVP